MRKIFVIVFCFWIVNVSAQNRTKNNSGDYRKPFQVLVFLGTDCPISQDYIGVLNNIQNKYSKVGRVQGILPVKISKKQLKHFQAEYQVKFTLETDKNYTLVKKFNISVTPEVILLDSTGAIRYHGAIDNWYYELGRHRQVTTENYLTNAIDAIVAGKDPEIKDTEPVGCILPKLN